MMLIPRFFLLVIAAGILISQTACTSSSKVVASEEANPYVDPVCGNTANLDSSFRYDYNGRVYYFDSDECRAVFQKNPERFASHQVTRGHHHNQAITNVGWWGAGMVTIVVVAMTSVMVFGHAH